MPADLTLSDVYASASVPPLSESTFTTSEIGIIPFCIAVADNSVSAGINNINREQLTWLFSDGNNMPASYLGSSSTTAKVYLVGRNPLSGTRVTVERVSGNANATESCWNTNGATSQALFRWNSLGDNGFSSGGTLVSTLIAASNDTLNPNSVAIGYAGYADCVNVDAATGIATVKPGLRLISYNGVPFSLANVANGSYLMWGYEHMMWRPGPSGLSGVQLTVAQKLRDAIKDPAFQLDPLGKYYTTSVPLTSMMYSRSVDGGPLSVVIGVGPNWGPGSLGQ